MRPADIWRPIFGSGERWDYRLVASRIAAILVVDALLRSPWKHYAAFIFWPLFIAFLASVVYQWHKRWRGLKRSREESRSSPEAS